MDKRRIRVGVIGAGGYAGSELLRILLLHPDVVVTYVAGTSEENRPMEATHPYLANTDGLRLEAYDPDACSERCDAVFVALPAGVSGAIALDLFRRGKRAIDLSGDLRLPGDLYEHWYKRAAVATHPQELGAVYGLTEWHRDELRDARLVANPGCYATAALLSLLPLVRAGYCHADFPIILDAKSGVSGAGRKPALNTTLGGLYENFYAYKVGVHQHTPEIEWHLGAHHSVMLTTQLLPAVRGIYLSAYIPAHPEVRAPQLYQTYVDAYAASPFVRILPPGQVPQLKHVRGSNLCHIGMFPDATKGLLQVFAAMDNLQKGAAGQAVQNFNLMYGLPEQTGLSCTALYP